MRRSGGSQSQLGVFLISMSSRDQDHEMEHGVVGRKVLNGVYPAASGGNRLGCAGLCRGWARSVLKVLGLSLICGLL